MSPRARNGATARIVVSEVMTIAFRRRRPASRMARLSGRPLRRRVLIVSILRIESLMTMPQTTIRPIIDIRLSDSPKSRSTRIAPNRSMTISDRMIHGWTSDSNCAARMKKSSSSATASTPTSCPTMPRLEK